MKKGSKLTKQQRLKVSLGLKKYFKENDPWNKGLKTGLYDEPAHIRFRRDPNYYLNELKQNAIRAKKKGYHSDPERRKEIQALTDLKQKQTGAGRKPRRWSDEEISYLEDNYENTTILEIALLLQRSWVSVMHRAIRLGLKKYNKWT